MKRKFAMLCGSLVAAGAKKCMASGVPATTSHTTSRAPFIVASSGAWRCIKSMGSIAI